MRKTLAYVGLSILLSWVVMFIAFIGQMATTASTHFESTPVNPFSVTLMAGLLGVGLAIIAVGYLTKEAG